MLPMLFKPIWSVELAVVLPGHTRRTPPVPLSIPPFLYPSIFNQCLFWPGIWSLLSSFLSILILFFIHFIFWFYASLLSKTPIFLSGYRAYSLPLYISPCLSLGPCVALLYPSVRLIRPSVHVSVCLSVRQGCPTVFEEDVGTLTSCAAGGPESAPV